MRDLIAEEKRQAEVRAEKKSIEEQKAAGLKSFKIPFRGF
jgi:hypothetical protein